jgi:hypothetical protein
VSDAAFLGADLELTLKRCRVLQSACTIDEYFAIDRLYRRTAGFAQSRGTMVAIGAAHDCAYFRFGGLALSRDLRSSAIRAPLSSQCSTSPSGKIHDVLCPSR